MKITFSKNSALSGHENKLLNKTFLRTATCLVLSHIPLQSPMWPDFIPFTSLRMLGLERSVLEHPYKS